MRLASEYLKWKYRDVKPEEKPEYTKKERAVNWWRYHRKALLVAAALLIALVDISHSVLGIGAVKPDLQAACVGAAPLTDETIRAVEAALTALMADGSGDGRVVVRLHVCADMSASPDGDQPQYAQAARVKLMADLEACESYLFILDDPETFHANYQILAAADGSLAEGRTEPFWLPVEACPALQGIEGLSGLSLARRGFWGERTCKYKDQCDALWAKLTEEADP